MTTPFYYLYIFIFGGFLGWILDTGFRFYADKRYAPGTLIPFFSIIYGVGAVVLDVVFVYTPLPAVLQVLFGAILAVLLELVSGLVMLAVLKRRLWRYRGGRFNYRGLIDLEHSIYWLLLIAAYRVVYHFFM
ncbi:MAG: putative ABC transporter permease [Candidatus Magasanikbacteria bacterium]|nr:putative ABC transporter permease [Candidatus Magasanikbacteria bacterium]